MFLLQWRKAAKARRKVRERSEYHYLYTKYAHENMIIIPCPDSAVGRKVAKGRESTALIRAVLGNHNFEQLPCDDAPWGCGFKGLKSKTGRAGLVFSRISRYLHDRTCIYIYIYIIFIYIYNIYIYNIYIYVFDGICTWYSVERTPRSRANISALLACPCHTNLAPS